MVFWVVITVLSSTNNYMKDGHVCTDWLYLYSVLFSLFLGSHPGHVWAKFHRDTQAELLKTHLKSTHDAEAIQHVCRGGECVYELSDWLKKRQECSFNWSGFAPLLPKTGQLHIPVASAPSSTSKPNHQPRGLLAYTQKSTAHLLQQPENEDAFIQHLRLVYTHTYIECLPIALILVVAHK